MNGSRDGAVEIQFNVTDHRTLVELARKGQVPDQLLVRVSGYTAYFKDLNPRMQKEIIDRTEYLLSSGTMQPYEPFPLRGKTEPT
jgi:pyruvate-formate lyase